jgi:hypothetical protein
MKIMNRQRLLELAGLSASPEVNDQSANEPKEEHLKKETHCFKQAHDALEKLMEFFKSQESFEKKRDKESEYTVMEKHAEFLMQEMKKHLSEY